MHGLPMTPEDIPARVLAGRSAFVSFANPEQLGLALTVCQLVGLDNGAYVFETAGREMREWAPYYGWCAPLQRHPSVLFAIIPDVIDGGAADNDALLAEWPHGKHFGVPVYHLDEPLDRLERLAADWPRVALGSSGAYWDPGSPAWWNRIAQAMEVICDGDGLPRVKLHGLRMLDPAIFTHLPLASADSTNVARNIGLDTRWVGGAYQPKTKAARAAVLIDRIEAHQGAPRWLGRPVQEDLFARSVA